MIKFRNVRYYTNRHTFSVCRKQSLRSNKVDFNTPHHPKLISKLCEGYLGYVKPISLFESVCRIKLTAFTHQFAYNFPKSDLELEIERELICANDTHIYTNPKYEIQYFIDLVSV